MPVWDVNFDLRLDNHNYELISSVAKAHAFASVIRGIPIPPAVEGRIAALNILRAVRGTTGIEGANLTEDEVRMIMDAPSDKPVLPANRRREEQEARNAERVMYFVADQLGKNRDLPLTEELICEIHRITTENIDYSGNVPGQYRSHAVTAGTYTPPRTEGEVRKLMKQFIAWFNTGLPSTWDPIVRAIIAHFYIVSIHPFGEGNGRTARGVECFLLFQAGVNARGFYSLANYYYRNRNDYIQLLDHVRFESNGNLTPFVLFGLKGLASELEAVVNEILPEVKLIAFRDFARELLEKNGKLATKPGDRMFHFLLGLGREAISVKDLREGKHRLFSLYRNVSSKTLGRDIDYLKKHGLIRLDGDHLRANSDIMTAFTPPFAYSVQRSLRQERKPSK